MRIKKAIKVLRREGVHGIYERMTRRLARSLEIKNSALTVTHEQAMKWFEHRRGGYGRAPSLLALTL